MLGNFKDGIQAGEHGLEFHPQRIAELADKNIHGNGENGFDDLRFCEVFMKPDRA